jgi:hypothetical protein
MGFGSKPRRPEHAAVRSESTPSFFSHAGPYAVGNVLLTILGPLIVTLAFSG